MLYISLSNICSSSFSIEQYINAILNFPIHGKCHLLTITFFLLSLTVVLDVQDSSEVIGHLVVTVEALEALISIMKDPERDHPLTTLA